MKKFLTVLLAAAMAFACVGVLASCGKDETPDLYDVLDQKIEPTRTVSTTKYTFVDNGDNEVTLHGTFDTSVSGKDSITTYTYERMALPAEDAESRIVTVKGGLFVNGDKTWTDGDPLDEDAVPQAAVKTVELNSARLSGLSAKMSEDGKELTVTIPASRANSVLGVPVAARNNVTLTITTNGVHVTGIVISYLTLNEAAVEIRTSYSYNVLELSFPAAPAD